jgi:molybdopterin converting factor subunit 1
MTANPAMRINVKFFAIVRDRAGVSNFELDVPAQSTVANVSSRLAEEFPAISTMLSRAAFAVNQSYVPATTELHDGDELAIIPPVSGG